MSGKADGDTVRRQNRNSILKTLRQLGAQPRVELGRLTGLSPASVTTISAQLIDEGLIEELDAQTPIIINIKRGRPVVLLALKPGAAKIIAAKISLEGMDASICDYTGEVIANHHAALPFGIRSASAPHVLADWIAKELIALLSAAKISYDDIANVGVAVQGHADVTTGILKWSPAFHGRNLPIAEPLQLALGVPCTVANDANMIAEGLRASDPLQYGPDTLCVFIGHGVGLGIIADGKVYQGATGAAAEFGHSNHVPGGALCLCGKRGCLEAYAGGYAIVRRARGHTHDRHDWDDVSPEDIVAVEQRARSGDAMALKAFHEAGQALGFGIGRLVAILNPGRVVLTGSLTSAADLMDQPMHHAISESVVESLRAHVEIEFANVEGDVILRGTSSVLLREIDLQHAAGPTTTRQLA
jgi:predicted NBD/HSP70 family sugar kinase